MKINKVRQYIKKPIVIEAIKFVYGGDNDSYEKIKKWAGDCVGYVYKARCPGAKAEMQVKTLEDGNDTVLNQEIKLKVTHIATEGDYIIKGVKGEFYACKPDIFEETYEEI